MLFASFVVTSIFASPVISLLSVGVALPPKNTLSALPARFIDKLPIDPEELHPPYISLANEPVLDSILTAPEILALSEPPKTLFALPPAILILEAPTAPSSAPPKAFPLISAPVLIFRFAVVTVVPLPLPPA